MPGLDLSSPDTRIARKTGMGKNQSHTLKSSCNFLFCVSLQPLFQSLSMQGNKSPNGKQNK